MQLFLPIPPFRRKVNSNKKAEEQEKYWDSVLLHFHEEESGFNNKQEND